MKRFVVASLIAGTSIVGLAGPAFAGGTCQQPPPKECDWRPGWGGAGAVHSPEADGLAPGGGTGDQNHCHSGPPGLGFPRYDK